MSLTEPREGRTHCTAVTDNGCLAPAGYRVGQNAGGMSGKRREDLHTCAYCAEPVCDRCAVTRVAPPWRHRRKVAVCREHIDNGDLDHDPWGIPSEASR